MSYEAENRLKQLRIEPETIAYKGCCQTVVVIVPILARKVSDRNETSVMHCSRDRT